MIRQDYREKTSTMSLEFLASRLYVGTCPWLKPSNNFMAPSLKNKYGPSQWFLQEGTAPMFLPHVKKVIVRRGI